MRRIFQALLGLLILWASMLHAKVCIEITKGVDVARPIGIVPFTWTGSGVVPEDIGEIIAADLRNSGKFNPIPSFRFPQQPVTISEVMPDAWRALGVDVVVIGQVQPSANFSYLVSYQLIDTSDNMKTILEKNQYKVKKKWLRYAAHSASDEMFEKLIGIKGVFRTRIAYVVHIKDRKYPYELCVADYDGYNQSPVHRSSELLMSPAWSPDGNQLAYVRFEKGHSSLVLQTLDTGSIRTIAHFPQHNGAPAFSHDGKKLVFALSKTGSLNLYVIDLASGQIHQVTEGRSNNTEPTWFPDNETLAYTSDQGGRPQVYKIAISGGRPQRLSWEGDQNQDADVSADGKFLVMVNTSKGVQHIAKLDLVTGGVQILTDTFLDETPSIAPNGTMVIYSASQELASVLQLVSVDGRFNARLPGISGQVKFPAWSPYL